MSRRARERQEASDAKHYPERWQDERDEDEKSYQSGKSRSRFTPPTSRLERLF